MAVAKPNITWAGAHPANFRQGRNGFAPEAVCLHIAEGTVAGCISWFNTPPGDGPGKRGRDRNGNLIGPSSATFVIGKDGSIVQFVQLADCAYANGQVAGHYTAALVNENEGANANDWTYSLEHEGFSGEQPTPAQFDASTRLTAWLFQDSLFKGGATGVAVDRKHILGHFEFDNQSRAGCPGWGEATLQRYVARVKELLMSTPTPPPAPDFRALYVQELRGELVAGIDDQQRAAVRIETATNKLREMGERV